MKLLKEIKKLTELLEMKNEAEKLNLDLVSHLSDILKSQGETLEVLTDMTQYQKNLCTEVSDLKNRLFCDDNLPSGKKVYNTQNNKNYIVIYVVDEHHVVCMDPSVENLDKDDSNVGYEDLSLDILEDGWKENAFNDATL